MPSRTTAPSSRVLAARTACKAGLERLGQHFTQQRAIRPARPGASTGVSCCRNLVRKTQGSQGAEHGRLNRYSGSIRAPLTIQIDEMNLMSLPQERDGTGHPADAPAYDQYFKWAWHVTPAIKRL